MKLNDKYKHIPQDMKKLAQWVGYMRTPILKDGKPDKNADGTPRMSKIPIDVHTLGGASSIAVHSWGNFERAMNIIGKTATVGRQRQQGTVEGVGFVFRPDKNTGMGICGIDLDHIIDPNTKQINAAAKEIIDTMDTYTEYSPSGTGVHMYYYGACHSEWEKKFNGCLGGAASMEMYQEKRYFTVTGNVFGEPKPIAEREQQAAEIYKRYAPSGNNTVIRQNSDSGFFDEKARVRQTSVLSDVEVLEKASKSKQGSKLTALLNGDTSAYGNDQSRADQALCNMLAFWCGGDTKQIDRIFRNSGLMRKKWDEKRGNNTYGEITVNKAVLNCKEYYTANRESVMPQENYNKPSQSTKNAGEKAQYTEDSVRNDGEQRQPELTYELVKRYKADDIGASQLFSDMVKSFVCYVPELKLFRLYDGTKWQEDSLEALETGNVLMRFVRAVQGMIPPAPKGIPHEWTQEQIDAENTNKKYRGYYFNLSYTGKRNHLL
ncbi:MAG: hypothetical protein IIT49_06990, partial [Clostridia bacterium]|nr:hypothetical protein [Clostridia bacterium]